jgi:hypothetical protein
MIDKLEALYTGQDPESLNVSFRHEKDTNPTKMLSQEQKKHARSSKNDNRLNKRCAV